MGDNGRTDALQRLADAAEFAREELGPASEELVSRPSCQALILSRLRSGVGLPDAVLWLAHRETGDERVANEFVRFFLTDMMRRGRPEVSAELRRFLDTGDLVQSVLGDVWGEFSRIEFSSRVEFLGLLSKRLRWKASDHSRRLLRDRRREDLRTDLDVIDILPDRQRTPDQTAALREDAERLKLATAALSPRDRLLVRLYLEGASIQETARKTGLSPGAAKKAVQRAVARVRRMGSS